MIGRHQMFLCGCLMFLGSTAMRCDQRSAPPTARPGAPAARKRLSETRKPPKDQARPDAKGRLPRWALRQDLRKLKHLLESTHPDPFTGGGGSIAFNRRFRQIWDALPKEGLTPAGFLRQVRPLVASVRDGHTTIGLGRKDRGKEPPRLGIDFGICDRRLYVRQVHRPEHRPLLGGELVSLAGVPFAELKRRMSRIRGWDNKYTNLLHLADAFRRPALLADLLGSEIPSRVKLGVRLAGDKQQEVTLTLAPRADASALAPPTTLELPAVNAADIGHGFLDKQKTIAYLRVDSMMRYREAFEFWRSTGFSHNLKVHLDRVVAKASGNRVTTDLDAKIKAVPSATGAFRDLAAAMRKHHTKILVVDLRRNRGGNSFLGAILVYFLYGPETLASLDRGYQIPRYSELYFQQHKNVSKAKKLGHAGLEVGDYDYSEEQAWKQRLRHGPTAAQRKKASNALTRAIARSPTFKAEFARHSQPIKPSRVVVITSASTYSAGYDLAALLYKQGAVIVGTPSSQAGNCFIDSLFYQLHHSKLSGSISYKRSLDFPENPRIGRVLSPDISLTCQRLRELKLDPNASVILALEHLRKPAYLRRTVYRTTRRAAVVYPAARPGLP